MQADERYVCLTGGFGCGKSFGIGLKAWNLARINAGFDGMLVSRSATQLRKLCVEVETVFNLLGVAYRKRGFDEYHLDFGTKTPTIIYLGTTENDAYKRWAGGNLAWVVIDEIDTMPKADEVWKFANDRVRVKAPLLQTACASTPEGYGFLWDFFDNQVKKDGSLAASRRLVKGCTFDNPFIDPSYVRDQIQTRDPQTLRAYVYGDFVNLEGVLVYYRYDKQTNATNLTIDDPMFKDSILHVGVDFNKGINAASVSVVKDGIGYTLHEFWGAPNVDVLIASMNKHLRGREFYIYPDASGFEGIAQLERAYGADQTRVLYPTKNPPIERRVTSVNERLMTASGMPRWYINPATCPRLANGLLRQTKNSDGAPDKTKGLDHMLDGFGYFIWHHWPVKGDGALTQRRLAT
jgi:hypothetical protein